MFISGMGFFTDAYDLFIIGAVMTMLKPLWNVGKLEEGLVESTALLASVSLISAEACLAYTRIRSAIMLYFGQKVNR